MSKIEQVEVELKFPGDDRPASRYSRLPVARVTCHVPRWHMDEFKDKAPQEYRDWLSSVQYFPGLLTVKVVVTGPEEIMVKYHEWLQSW